MIWVSSVTRKSELDLGYSKYYPKAGYVPDCHDVI